MLFIRTIIVGCLLHFIPAIMAQNALTIEYSTVVNGVNETFHQEGQMLDTCLCNSTACSIVTAFLFVTAVLSPTDGYYIKTTTQYPNSTECYGANAVVTVENIGDNGGSVNFQCDDGEHSIPSFMTVSIRPSDSYTSLDAYIVFSYSSQADCSGGIYNTYDAMFYPTCGGILSTGCMENVTSYAESATTLAVIEYKTGACTDIMTTEYANIPTDCSVSDDDANDSNNEKYYENYMTILLQAPNGYPSSGGSTYTVTKGAYVALIVMVFVAFGLGIALACGYVKYATKPQNDNTERLTALGAIKSHENPL